MKFEFSWLQESQIDSSDATFQVRSRHAEGLLESVRRIGIRTPLLVEPAGERYLLVSGWGRWLARPPGEPIPCYLLPPGLSQEALWDAFLLDNDAWNIVEIARILKALEAVPGLTEERVVSSKLPLLGIHASSDLHRMHRRLLGLGPEALRFIEDEDLPLRRTAVFFKLPRAGVESLIDAARGLHLTLNEIGETGELLEEIGGRDGVPVAEVLEDLRRAPGCSDKDGFRRELHRRRYPELSRLRGRLDEIAKRLSFSVPVKVEWDPLLERPGFRLVADLKERGALATFERELPANRKALEDLLDGL